MKRIYKLKSLLCYSVIQLFLFIGGYAQQDTIQFSWQAASQENKEFRIEYHNLPYSKQLILSWGDGTVDTITTQLSLLFLNHTYDLAGTYTLTITSPDTLDEYWEEIRLECPASNVISLDISRWRYMEGIYCVDNHLPLSDLYAISERISFLDSKGLGTQRMFPRRIFIDDTVDYSSQKKIGDTATVFTLNKNSRTL